MSQSKSNQSKDEERDLTGEGNAIKAILTQKKPEPQEPETPKTSLVKINFTTLAQSVLPGFFLRKRLGQKLTIEYIPDTFYLIELCQRIFISAKSDKSLKKVDEVNIFSFTLYVAHTLMYAYLKVVQDVNPPNVDLTTMLNVYHSAGFDSNSLPSICSHWLDGLGKYQDPQTGKIFLPKLPSIEAGALSQSGFFNADTGHLIPNTYCLSALTRVAADRQTGQQVLTAVAQHCMTGIFGTDLTHKGVKESTLCRANALRVPGGKALGQMCSDTELITLVEVALTTKYTDELQNLLKVTPNLLSHLKRSQELLFLEIATIKLDSLSPVGTALVTIPLVSEEPESVVIPEKRVSSTAGPPLVPAMTHYAEYDHFSRIQTRYEVINGYVDYAYQTPIVRIVKDYGAIVVPERQFHDPQDPWYTNEIEFLSYPTTLNETRAPFGRRP